MNAPAPERPRAWPLYRAMVGVGLVCGLVIVGVYQLTAPRIARNEAEALQRAIFRVLPAATSSRTFAWTGDGFSPAGDGDSGELVHAGYADDGGLAGLAVEAVGMGYQDRIRVLYGYDPMAQAVVGMQVLESRETPGLGDRISTDPAFQANFEALDVSLDAEGDSLAHPVVAVKHGEKTGAWEVDGITGATISSEAIADLLHRSASTWMPRVQAHLEDFRRPEEQP